MEYVRRFGKPVHRTGVTFYILRKRDIPLEHRRNDVYAKLEGAVILVGDDGGVVTTYRNKRAYRQVRKKVKYRLPKAASTSLSVMA